MFKAKYYVAVLICTLGASTQFYSNNVVNPSQVVVTAWINHTYLERYETAIVMSAIIRESSLGVEKNKRTKATAYIQIKEFANEEHLKQWIVNEKENWRSLIARKVGRRNGLFSNGVLNVFGASLVYLAKPAHAPELLIIGRLILGANVGLGSGLVPMYLMEITPLRYRGAAGTAHEVAIAFSDSFSMLVALPEVLGDGQNWPLAYAFPGLPALLLCLVIFLCPESPKYALITRGQSEKAMSDLRQLVCLKEARAMFNGLVEEAASMAESRPTFGELFARELRFPLFIAVWMMVAQQFTGVAAVFSYSTDMFSSAGLSPPLARYSTLALGVVYFVSTCSAAYLIERLGRRRLSIFQLSSITIVLGLVSIFALVQQNNKDVWLAYTIIALFVVYMGVYGIGSPIPWMITGEIFPTKFRPMAVTVTVFVSFSNAFIVSLGYLPFEQAVGVSASYLPFIGISAISAAIVYFMLPETKNRTSTAIVQQMEEKFINNKSPDQNNDLPEDPIIYEENRPLKSKEVENGINNYSSLTPKTED